MARRASVPPDQLQRLKGLYDEQRRALTALARAQADVERAEQAAGEAQQAVKQAKGKAETTYQALVELIGSAAAAELTGRGPARRTTANGNGHGGADREGPTGPVADGAS